ncbi:MAG: hypothetical protein FWG80_00450 [Alphaproteobacteria bacterium]|nr:hypothetical protein [Alphaproteobacteria bacterium]
MKLRLHSEAKILIMLSAIHSIVGTFFGTFLIAYIMQIAQSEAISISIYKIALYTVITLGFILLADTVKRKDKMQIYRISILIQALCLGAIALTGDGIAPYIAIFGAVYGLAMAFRHCPFNIIIGEKIKKRMMTAYTGYSAMVSGIASVATPLFLGLFITIGSYEHMAVAMLLFLGFELILSFFIRSRNVTSKRFSLSVFIPQARRSILVRRVFLTEFLAGFSYSEPLNVVTTMYIVYLFHTNLNLGIISSVFAGVAIMVSFLVGRYGRPEHFPILLIISNILVVSTAFIFLVFTGKLSFILYRFAQSSGMNFITKVKNINTFNTSNSAACVSRDCRAEFFVVREMALNLGRILSFLILFTIGFSGNMDWLKWYLVIMTLCVAAGGTMSLKICRHNGVRKYKTN